MTRIALIQEAPVFLDKHQTVEKAARIVQDAGSDADLVVFPETFIPGYPAWIWRVRPGADWSTCEELHQRLLDNSVDLDSADLAPLRQAAAETRTTVVCGLNERDNRSSRGTIYNTVVVISDDGSIINIHRKLMPTNPERMVWGFGDASGLKVVDTPAGRLGTLICWENFMPLARYSLYAQGVELYIAPTYDSGTASITTMQHIAREGRCWVLCCGVALERSDLPTNFPRLDELYPEDELWINPGDSLAVAPGGTILAGPLTKEKGRLVVDIDPGDARYSRRALDVAGHYARPDIFQLVVNRTPQHPVTFADSDAAPTAPS